MCLKKVKLRTTTRCKYNVSRKFVGLLIRKGVSDKRRPKSGRAGKGGSLEFEQGNSTSFLLLVVTGLGFLSFFFFFYWILGGVYKFCWCIRGKEEWGRRHNERRYSVLVSLLFQAFRLTGLLR